MRITLTREVGWINSSQSELLDRMEMSDPGLLQVKASSHSDSLLCNEIRVMPVRVRAPSHGQQPDQAPLHVPSPRGETTSAPRRSTTAFGIAGKDWAPPAPEAFFSKYVAARVNLLRNPHKPGVRPPEEATTRFAGPFRRWKCTPPRRTSSGVGTPEVEGRGTRRRCGEKRREARSRRGAAAI